jgi:PTH1 family peptidyl-tRNA hydrolase
MKLIVALGNPGKKYDQTRHNAGFLALDYFLKDIKTITCSSRFNGHVCEAHFTATQHPRGPIKVFFVKPKSFMNNSGEPVQAIINFYKINPESDLLVIHDELDLKFGYWKPAFDSRAAGHNGVQSIIDHLGTQKFHRLRIGVESRKSRLDQATDEYVLTNFSSPELALLNQEVFPDISQAITDFIYQK